MALASTAMEDGGYFETAEEFLVRSRRKGRRLMRQLEASQAPRIRKAGPMV